MQNLITLFSIHCVLWATFAPSPIHTFYFVLFRPANAAIIIKISKILLWTNCEYDYCSGILYAYCVRTIPNREKLLQCFHMEITE